MQKLLAFSGVATAAAIARSGEDVHCVGDRAHILKYDIEGEENDGSSMTGIQKAMISFDAARHHDQQCVNSTSQRVGGTPSGHKKLCYGVNQNSDCSGAERIIPLENGALDCKDCYAAVEADAFYALNYTVHGLNSVQAGLRDIHVLGSASLHKSFAGTTTVFKNSYNFPTRRITVIDRLVGCPVCIKVKVTVAVPTALDYELDLTATADITAGAQIDAHLSDRWAKWDRKEGWSYPEYKRDVTVNPLLSIDNTDIKANLNLGLRTSVQVELDNIFWYHFNILPSLPLTAELSGDILPSKPKEFCLKGDADMTLSHEADLDWHFLRWHLTKDHWGPTQDKEWSKPGVINYCKTFEQQTEVVV